MPKPNGEVMMSELREMKRLFFDGKSIHYIALSTGRCRQTVRRLLAIEGVRPIPKQDSPSPGLESQL